MKAVAATALFFTTTGWLGGAERSMLELAAELRRGGQPVHGLFPDGGGLAAAWQAAGLPWTAVRLPAVNRAVLRNPAAVLSGAGELLRGLEALGAEVVRHSPAILHANSLSAAIHAALLARLKPPAGGALTATIWHCRDLVNLLGFRAAVFPSLTRVIAISATVRRHLLDFGLPPEKLVLIRNGIGLPVRAAADPVARAAARKALGLEANLPVALHVSQFAPWKKTPLFLEVCRAAGEQQPVQVLLIGREPGGVAEGEAAGEAGADEAMPASIRTGIERLRVAGRRVVVVAEADAAGMEQAFRAADVLVHTAISEPFGRVILEAMARGVVVLGRGEASGGGGPAELIEHAKTGWLVGRDEEFAPALVRLLGDVAGRQALAAGAQTEAYREMAGVAVHSTERVAAEVEALFRTLS